MTYPTSYNTIYSNNREGEDQKSDVLGANVLWCPCARCHENYQDHTQVGEGDAQTPLCNKMPIKRFRKCELDGERKSNKSQYSFQVVKSRIFRQNIQTEYLDGILHEIKLME